MNQYNDQYYIVFKKYDENTLYLSPRKDSAMRNYEFTKLDDSTPMYFENAYREEDISKGIDRPLKDAHMAIAYPVISNAIRVSLGNISNEYFQIFPAVIVDDNITTKIIGYSIYIS